MSKLQNGGGARLFGGYVFRYGETVEEMFGKLQNVQRL
jgi:hypothetical protein